MRRGSCNLARWEAGVELLCEAAGAHTMTAMPRPPKAHRRRLARGTSAPEPRVGSETDGPTPVMDAPLSTPTERVELHHASAAIRSLLAARAGA